MTRFYRLELEKGCRPPLTEIAAIVFVLAVAFTGSPIKRLSTMFIPVGALEVISLLGRIRIRNRLVDDYLGSKYDYSPDDSNDDLFTKEGEKDAD